MKTLAWLLLATAAAIAADGAWISLFDGKTLAGWQGFGGPANPVWIVKDGAIVVNRSGTPGTPGNGNSRSDRNVSSAISNWNGSGRTHPGRK